MPPRRKVTLTLGPRKKQKTDAQQTVDEAAAEAAAQMLNTNLVDSGIDQKDDSGNVNVDSIDSSLSRFKNLSEFYNDVIENAVNFKDPETEEIISGPFIKLPPKKIYADYYQLITNPISINEIKQATVSKRKNAPEVSLDEFADMWKLMSTNAATYNDPESLIVNDANLIRDYALQRIDEYKNYLNAESSKIDENKPTPVSETTKSQTGTDELDDDYDENDTEDYSTELQKILRHLLSFKVSHHKNSIPLSRALLDLPDKNDPETEDFYEIVTDPISFNMISEKLDNGEYSRGKSGYRKFVRDVNLMFDNYLDVFTSGQYLKSAQGLSKAFSKRLEKFEQQILDKKQIGNNKSNSSKSRVKSAMDDSYYNDDVNDDETNYEDDISDAKFEPENENGEISNTNNNIEVQPSMVEMPTIIRKHDIEKASKIEEIDDITAFIKKFTICSTTNLNNYATILKDTDNMNQINFPSIYETIITEPAGKSTVGGSNYILQLPGDAVIGHDIACNVYLQNKIVDEKYVSELRVNGETVRGAPVTISYDEDSDENGMFCSNKYALKLGYGLNYCEFTLKVPFPLRGRSSDVSSNGNDESNLDEKVNRQERHEREKSQEFIENVKIWLNITR